MNQGRTTSDESNQGSGKVEFGIMAICVPVTYLGLFIFLHKIIGLQQNDALKKAVGAAAIALTTTFVLCLILGSLCQRLNKTNNKQPQSSDKTNKIDYLCVFAIFAVATYSCLFPFLHKAIGLELNDALKKAVGATVIALATTFGLFFVLLEISEKISTSMEEVKVSSEGVSNHMEKPEVFQVGGENTGQEK